MNADRGIQMQSDVIDVLTPDCDDPSLPGWKEHFKDGMTITVNGGGVLHTTSTQAWFDWMRQDLAKNVRIRVNTTNALGGGYISGAFKLTQFNLSGTRKSNITAEVTLISHGACTWTPA
jgi:predicted secreted protein